MATGMAARNGGEILTFHNLFNHHLTLTIFFGDLKAFKQAMAKREQEIMNIPGANERWENWVQFTQSRLVPKVFLHLFMSIAFI